MNETKEQTEASMASYRLEAKLKREAREYKDFGELLRCTRISTAVRYNDEVQVSWWNSWQGDNCSCYSWALLSEDHKAILTKLGINDYGDKPEEVYYS
jgi:hypothetical protein